MTGKENYNRAIEFKGPAYLPCTLGVSLDWLEDKDEAKRARVRELTSQFPNDILGWVGPQGINLSEPVRRDGVTRWIDEWGTGWEDDGHGAKTESYPLESGYEALAGYVFPDPHKAGRFDPADEALKQRGDRYVQGVVWFTLFERLWMLRGFENMLTDPYMQEDDFCRLRDRIVEHNLAIIDQLLKRKVDAVFFSDDWGCQRGLLMNPDDWRRFYKPSYKRMFERVRSGGAHVWMHLCGNITAILPDLIESGLNVLNPVQPQAMDVRQLSREFGGRVCFNGGVDVQGTLVRGTRDDVKREVHELVALFGKFNGGYIGGTSHSVMPETPLDNVIAMYEAFSEYQLAQPTSAGDAATRAAQRSDVMKDTTNMTDPKLLVRRAYDEFATKAAGVTRRGDAPDQKVLSNLLARLESGASVLDAGCGNGLPVARRLVDAGHHVTGIDISEGQLSQARKNVPEALFQLMDMEQTVLPSESFDAIVSYYAILHVPRSRQHNVLENFQRMLKPGGYAFLCLADSDCEGYISELGPVKEMYFSHFSAGQYMEMIAKTAFTVLWSDIVSDSTDPKARHLFVLLKNR